MRFAGNFNPEWGYLAPAPSFLRTLRIVLATAVGATAGAAVVFSLVDRPSAEASVAARTLAGPSPSAATPVSAPSQATALQTPLHGQVQATAKPAVAVQSDMSVPNTAAVRGVASESGPSSTTQRPASLAALTEAPAVTATVPQADDTTVDMPLPPQKKVAKKHRTAPPRGEQRMYSERVYGTRGPYALGAYFPLGEY